MKKSSNDETKKSLIPKYSVSSGKCDYNYGIIIYAKCEHGKEVRSYKSYFKS